MKLEKTAAIAEIVSSVAIVATLACPSGIICSGSSATGEFGVILNLAFANVV